MIDIIKQGAEEIPETLFDTLLFDHTTEKNICWATDYYSRYGDGYSPQNPITKDLIVGEHSTLIKPRIFRSLDEQAQRTKDKAEVFTPSWICNKQNNLVDDAWFEREDVFNTAKEHTWKANKEKIRFTEDKTWQQYVDSTRLEICCGEAPYLVSRYDTVTGNKIPLEERIGLLDRKLRVVNENTDNESEWFFWAKRAYESTYGYEYQGDNLLLARENLLYTFIENMEYKFSKKPKVEQLEEIAEIISWNIWQMDGLTMMAPYSERPKPNLQMSLSDFIDDGSLPDEKEKDVEPIPCRIFDWRANNSIEFNKIGKNSPAS